MKKIIFEKFIVSGLTILICIFVLEVGLRIKGTVPTNMVSGIHEQNGDSYRLKRNIIKKISWPAYSYTVYTNAFGFRDKSVGSREIKSAPFSIFLGASEVFGNGVDFEDSFVGIYAKYASEKGSAILNMAIGGHYFLDQEYLLKQFVRETNTTPEIVFFCLNALHIPKFDKRNDNVIVKNGFLFNKDDWKIPFIRLMIGNLSSAYCFIRDRVRTLQGRYLGFKPGEDPNMFLDIFSKNNRMYDEINIKSFEAYLDSFNNYCYSINASPIYIYTPIVDSYNLSEILESIGEDPSNYDAEYYSRWMNEYCQKNNIKFIDLRSVLKPYHDGGTELRFKLDPHYNEVANKILGEYLAIKLL
jgi:hypothetical protein